MVLVRDRVSVGQSATAPLPLRHCDTGSPALGLTLTALNHQARRRRGNPAAALFGDRQQRIGVTVCFESKILVRQLPRMRNSDRGDTGDVVDGVGESDGGWSEDRATSDTRVILWRGRRKRLRSLLRGRCCLLIRPRQAFVALMTVVAARRRWVRRRKGLNRGR